MGLEVRTPLQRLLNCCDADILFTPVCKVNGQGQSRDQLAVLGQVTFQHRLEFALPETVFKLRAPVQEQVVGIPRQPQVWQAMLIAAYPIAHPTNGAPLECVQCLEHLEGGFACLGLGLAVDVAPGCRYVRPNHHAEPLDQPIVAAAAVNDLREILAYARRLGAANHGDGDGLAVEIEPTADTIDSIWSVAVPTRQIKAALIGMTLLV